MSAGTFSDSKYQANNGGIFSIRIQPETAALTVNSLTNTAPSGDIDRDTRAHARGGKRKYGVTARTVTLKPVGTTAPATYKSGGILTVPLLTPAIYDQLVVGQSATYLGVGYLVAGWSPERRR